MAKLSLFPKPLHVLIFILSSNRPIAASASFVQRFPFTKVPNAAVFLLKWFAGLQKFNLILHGWVIITADICIMH